jgi:predicted signal transduction protein with EAL and GGDEF domain
MLDCDWSSDVCSSDLFDLSGHEVRVGASIGIAAYPDHGSDVETLMRHADIAMYHVKTHGKNHVRVFSDDLLQSGEAVKVLLADIALGIERDEFEIFYQPIVDLADGGIVGIEALARWHNPERGLMMPGQFFQFVDDHQV